MGWGVEMSEKDKVKKALEEYFDMAFREGMRKSTEDTIEALRIWIKRGGIIDNDFLDNLEKEFIRIVFLEDYGTYSEYIKSNAWREKALAAKERAGWHCQLCNKEGDKSTLHAHHRTYDRLGHELDADIIALCAECHAKFHGKDQTP